MKTETYEKKDGTKGENKWLEAGDEFIIVDQTPRINTDFGKYPNYSLKIVHAGNELFVRLTKGQYTRLMNPELHPLTNKIFKVETYTAEYKDQEGKTQKRENCLGLTEVNE